MAQARHLGIRESATFGLLGHGVSGILPKRRHGALLAKTVTIPRTDADPQRLLVLPRGRKSDRNENEGAVSAFSAAAVFADTAP